MFCEDSLHIGTDKPLAGKVYRGDLARSAYLSKSDHACQLKQCLIPAVGILLEKSGQAVRGPASPHLHAELRAVGEKNHFPGKKLPGKL